MAMEAWDLMGGLGFEAIERVLRHIAYQIWETSPTR